MENNGLDLIMIEILEKFIKRNLIYSSLTKISFILLVGFLFSLPFGYFRNSFLGAIIFIIFASSTVIFHIKSKSKIELEDLEIIKDDNNFLEFKPFLKDYVKSDRDFTYDNFIAAYEDFKDSKLPENVIKKSFLNTLKSEIK